MYLQKMLVLNSGATSKAKIDFPFHEDGRPKPVVLVGGNGTGKTNILSIVADGLMELAQLHYGDALPASGLGYSFYRISGGKTCRVGCKYELSALGFIDGDKQAFVRNQNGVPPFDELAEELNAFGSVNADDKSAEPKIKKADKKLIESVFRDGVYTYFPSSRNELPYWLNHKSLASDPEVDFTPRFTSTMDKPLVLERGIGSLKPWIIDIILDQSLDAGTVIGLLQTGQNTLPPSFGAVLQSMSTLRDLNAIIRLVLADERARIVRTNRLYRDRRIQILFGDQPGLPSLDNLSAGQATLLSVFGNALRLGTSQQIASSEASVGIVLVDEIDAHVHANLQYEAIPKLIAMFPKIQFIVTCHSPLLPLGMERQFGKDGYQILEMPSAIPISAERYSEFLQSLTMYEATKAFEERLREVGSGGRPLVIGEGETDPVYFATAAELLGYKDVLNAVDFTWIGNLDQSPKKTSGQHQLKRTVEIYSATIDLLARKIVCVFDQKSEVKTFANKKLFVLKLPSVEDHPNCNDGPENLLPPDLFEDAFYNVDKHLTGATEVQKRSLRKKDFAEYVCQKIRNPQHFERFVPVLNEIRKALASSAKPQPSQP